MGALVTLVGISVAVLVVVGGVEGAHPYQTGWILLSAASLNVRSSTHSCSIFSSLSIWTLWCDILWRVTKCRLQNGLAKKPRNYRKQKKICQLVYTVCRVEEHFSTDHENIIFSINVYICILFLNFFWTRREIYIYIHVILL